jgi:hypothetical protein
LLSDLAYGYTSFLAGLPQFFTQAKWHFLESFDAVPAAAN